MFRILSALFAFKSPSALFVYSFINIFSSALNYSFTYCLIVKVNGTNSLQHTLLSGIITCWIRFSDVRHLLSCYIYIIHS